MKVNTHIFENESLDKRISRLDNILNNIDNYSKEDLVKTLTLERNFTQNIINNDSYRKKMISDLDHLDKLNDLAFKGFSTLASGHELNTIINSVSYYVSQIDNTTIKNNIENEFNRIKSIFFGFLKLNKNDFKQFTTKDLISITDRFSNKLYKITIDHSCQEIDKLDLYTYNTILYTIFYNLISNSIYFSLMNKEQKFPEIHIFYDNYSFYISDSGCGVPESDIQFLFKYGYTKRKNGNGFGLALCKEYSEKYNIFLSYEPYSKFNIFNGSCFKVSLKK